MKNLLFLLFTILCFKVSAQNPTFEWVKQMGGINSYEVNSIATDANGNVYTAGYFSGTISFNSNIGAFNLVSIGYDDILILKLDASGNLLWIKQMGGTGSDIATSITTDINGNVYTAGFFYHTVDFDPGVGINNLTSAGYYDGFIQKLDSNGNLIWVKQIRGSNRVAASSITTDASGHIYTTGSFAGTTDFDPGIGITNLTSSGASDIFVQKLDTNGNLLWIKQIGGTGYDYGNSITTDDDGNVHTIGYFNNTVDFDPGVGITNLTSPGINSNSSFIQKLDFNGDLIWVKQIEGSSTTHSITTDVKRNVYITGYFYGTPDFDPGIGVTNLTSSGASDIFVQKLDSNGNLIWVKQMGGPNFDQGNSIITDTNSNVYITGYFRDIADFDPAVGITNLTSLGNDDIFIQKLDTNGNLVWVKQIGSTGFDKGTSITTNANGDIYTSGNFQNTADFDPGVGVTNLTSLGNDDVFIQKLSHCNLTTTTDTIIACDTYTWIDGNTYTTSNNTVKDTLTNSEGCTSIVTLDLTINYSSIATDIITACSTYTWIDGNTYTTSNNTATHTLINVTGCDSIVTLDLTINHPTTGIDTVITCDSHTWIDGITYTNSNSNNTVKHTLTNAIGCDSIITLNLTIIPKNNTIIYATINQGENFTTGTSTYTTGGTYIDTLTSSNGCDSIVTTNLEVITIDGIDPTLTTPLEVYPNPFNQFIIIKSIKKIPPQTFIQITDLLGKKMTDISYQVLNDEIKIDGTRLAKGTYFLHITGIGQAKIIKK